MFDTKDGREVAVSVIKDSLKLLGFQYIAKAKSSFETIFPQKL
jgi:hypothetical protein